MKTAHIIGLGKSGLAAARLLQFQGWAVCLHDRSDTPALQQQKATLEAEGLSVELGKPYQLDQLETLPQRVVVSPGVPWDLPGLQQAREAGIEVMGEMALAWHTLGDRPWVGITGTNGKTTTTALIAAIFQGAGLNAPACGNIGYAACELALQCVQGQPVDWVIAELSSYQIESSSEIAPQIGIWTTFTPDHLARHYTLENYFNIKAKLLEKSTYPIFNGDDPALRSQIPDRFPQGYWVSTQGKAQLLGQMLEGVYVESGWVCFQDSESQVQRVVQVQDLKMVGQHNAQNLLLATAAALKAGLEPQAIAEAVRQFPGVPHRLERVGTYQGVAFINDSKATNYDAAEVGLAAVDGPVILIAGGEAKEGNDRAWLQAIQQKVAMVLLIGKAAPFFAERLAQVGYAAVEIVETLDQAVNRSLELIPQLQPNVVLLSPACASFDQYPNFEVRGDHFRQLCQDL
jgi:UDP-N-acetylmuramoylalanine--D-glutamate ligase